MQTSNQFNQKIIIIRVKYIFGPLTFSKNKINP